MELGDKVTYYLHQINNNDHSTYDQMAFVVGGPHPDGSVDLMVCPAGGPVTFVTANEFDPDDPYVLPGSGFFRPWGEEPPAFEDTFPYPAEGDWVALRNRQRAERDAAMPAQRAKLREKHLAEREELGNKIAERYQPADAGPPEAIEETDPNEVPPPGGDDDDIPPTSARVTPGENGRRL